MGVMITSRVTVPAQKTRRREHALKSVFYLLCPQTEIANARALTVGAELEHLTLLTAIMTEQHAFGRVIRERNIATVAESNKTAIATEHTTCCATSVQIENRLLFMAQHTFKLFL